jgi:hypothetical protein
VALAVVREPGVLAPVQIANMVDVDAECRSAVTTPAESTYVPGSGPINWTYSAVQSDAVRFCMLR